MPDTGWLLPTNTGSHGGSGGTGAWYGNERIKAIDAISAFIGPVGGSLANNEVSHYLWGTGFGASIPAGGIVTGVSVQIRIRLTAGSAVLRDVLLRQDAPYGMFMDATNRLPNKALTTAWQTLEYGGQFNDWGWADLTRANVIKPGFGMAIAVRATSAGAKPEVDYVQIKIWYNTTQTITTDVVSAAAAPLAATALASSITISTSVPGSAAAPLAARAILGSVSAPSDAVAEAAAESLGGEDVRPSDYFLMFSLDDPPAAAAETIDDVVSLMSSVTLTALVPEAAASPLAGSVVLGSITLAPPTVGAAAEPLPGRASIAIRIINIPTPSAAAAPVDATVQIIWSVLALFPDFLRNSQQSAVRPFPLLVTITHPDLPTTLRYTDAGIIVESRGQVFQPLPMVVTLPMNGRDTAAEGSIVVPIQSRQIRGTFRTLSAKAARVVIEMVRGDDPDEVELTWRMRLAATETSQSVTLGLNDGDFETRSFPPLVFNAEWSAVHD